MGSREGLFLLGLLCLHSSAWGQEIGVLVFCDDPAVEKSVISALDKFNEGMTSGHKLALYQILSASKSEKGSDSKYSSALHQRRRATVQQGAGKPWTDCGHLLSWKPDDPVVRERAPCLGCPMVIDGNSEELKVPLSASISSYKTPRPTLRTCINLDSVGHATRQVVAGFRFKIWYDMKKTICAKSEHEELNSLCVPDERNLEFVNCNATVDVAPWRHVPPHPIDECEPGLLPPTILARRRPPGFTPLRTFEILGNTTKSLLSSTQASSKEESSEEDTTGPKPSGSPDVTNSPFHCPSMPWKPSSQAGPDSTPPAADTFTDLDLVG
ncbi:LOW QUALITY PROTEIN: kininogen-1 [Thalassophryne amazonica]|uniref:LOW QUALITY PROTEIN: kininogen-1 n=1 Tax=Thalassophryne amazonica TaxID=390379 RepID=UPI0014723A5A|nr:LOW QUALITY PROTEIN: kininogen-1 [Thalassophryne amazonica]